MTGSIPETWARSSNDGTRISFLRSAVSGHGKVVIANADGSNERQLESPLIGLAPHCWAPDDRSIVSVTAVEGLEIGRSRTLAL